MSKKYAVVAIGNAIVDVISSATDDFITAEALRKGDMTLIDAARATELYDRMGPGREVSGGSAANTIAGMAALGQQCGFIGQVADDQLGEVFAHDIRALGVNFDTPAMSGAEPTARCLILVTPDGQRTMNTFLGAAQNLPEARARRGADRRRRDPLSRGLSVERPGVARCDAPSDHHRPRCRRARRAHALGRVRRRRAPRRILRAAGRWRDRPDLRQ